MAITIDRSTDIIFVPQADLTFISGSVWQLDVDAFRLDLKDIDDSEEGIAFPDTHRHNTEVVLSGVTYARVVEILPPYTIEFEDGNYAVQCVGANHNIADVKVVNMVSLIIGNSAGLVVGPGLTAIVRQSWVLNEQPTSEMRGTVHLESGGERVALPTGAALQFQAYTRAGAPIVGFAGSGVLRTNGQDTFFDCVAPYVAGGGEVVVVRATLTGSGIGAGTHNGQSSVAFV